ncbi:Ltp family lipoprotein [Staphylococcus caprae]|nr:Ltp family lipoprotein [Staphylococcus caprae]MBX5316226.1 Ltp family lipoprotein [Staphylococcus caprae]MBX5322736.1 hypothetical protein [Staphylococcus caprae]PAK64480.1 hypothetical protein B9K00_06735 [Staphylococcus caprae]QDW94128.1 hypothetical protein DWB96_07820 [Staphylococcus caprae]
MSTQAIYNQLASDYGEGFTIDESQYSTPKLNFTIYV